jgi:hypothetical protein
MWCFALPFAIRDGMAGAGEHAQINRNIIAENHS